MLRPMFQKTIFFYEQFEFWFLDLTAEPEAQMISPRIISKLLLFSKHSN